MGLTTKGLTAGQTKIIAEKNAKLKAEAEAKAKAQREIAMQAEIDALRAQNVALKAAANKETFLKVGEKGGVSLYGLGRFPITLYKEQWPVLLAPAMVEKILAYLAEHDAELKVKGELPEDYAKRHPAAA